MTYIPPLVATGAVHHHLIRAGLRMQASIVVDTAQCWSTHHFACLVGYGASAVCPYLALESVRHWWHDTRTQKLMETGKIERVTLNGAQANYRKAVENGLLKILSKMGISLITSYQGAQIFEAVGIGADLLETAFRGTTSRLGGLNPGGSGPGNQRLPPKGLPRTDGQAVGKHGLCQGHAQGRVPHEHPRPDQGPAQGAGVEGVRPLRGLQSAARRAHPHGPAGSAGSDRAIAPPFLLDEVESAASIMERFCTGGMSLGALSQEAHEVLAIAMNRIGGKSNSGEGGEDPKRFKVLKSVDGEGRSELYPNLKGLRDGTPPAPPSSRWPRAALA
jgi:glutamate synthase (ferredoxin)